MSVLDTLGDLDFGNRTTQLVALAGVGIAGYVLFSAGRNPAGNTDAQAAAADAVRAAQPDWSGVNIPQGNSQNYPGWVGYPELPTQNPTTPKPVTPPANAGPCPDGKTAVWRDGKLTCPTASTNAAQRCPPGYTAIKSSAGARCVKSNEWGNTPGPTSYIPIDLAGTYQAHYRGMSPATPAAGEAFIDRWLGRGGDPGPNPYGTVRGFAPAPAPLGVGSARVRPGDSLTSLARRLYGEPGYWPMLVAKNGGAAATLRVGETIRG